MPVITLTKEQKTLEVPEGTNLRKALLAGGISPYRGLDRVLNCLGNGFCGTCRVEVVDGRGVAPPSPKEQDALVGLVPFYGRAIPKNVRLSCQIAVTKDLAIATYPAVSIDWKLTKERLAMTAIWGFFGLTLLFVVVRLLIEIATGA